MFRGDWSVCLGCECSGLQDSGLGARRVSEDCLVACGSRCPSIHASLGEPFRQPSCRLCSESKLTGPFDMGRDSMQRRRTPRPGGVASFGPTDSLRSFSFVAPENLCSPLEVGRSSGCAGVGSALGLVGERPLRMCSGVRDRSLSSRPATSR